MNNPKIYIYYLICFSICSCANSAIEKIQSGEITIINVDPDRVEDIFPWESFIDSFAIVPLETTKESVFSGIHKLIYNNDKFYIYDIRLFEISIYGEDGSFIRKLNKRGRGPGEYRIIKDFHFDGDNNLLILDYQAIHKYTPDLTYLYTIANEDQGEVISLCYFDDQHHYTFNVPLSFRDRNYLIKQKKGNQEFHFFENNLEVKSKERFIGYNKDFYMVPPYYDNHIYRVTPDSIFAQYKIDFNGRFINLNDLVTQIKPDEKEVDRRKEQGYIYGINRFYELSDYIYFEYIDKSYYRFAIFDKEKGSVVSAETNFLYDEVPIHIYGYSESQNCLFAVLEPYWMAGKKISDKLLSVYPELKFLNELSENANPIIIKLYLK